MPSYWRVLSLWIVLACVTGGRAADDLTSRVEGNLNQGKLKVAQQLLVEHLEKSPEDQPQRYRLGVVRLLVAIEQLAQTQYRYGALSEASRAIPILRIPVPPNPNPETISYPKLRRIFVEFQAGVLAAEKDLAQIPLTAECDILIDLMPIRFDIDGDGKGSDAESLQQMLAVVMGGNPTRERIELLVHFDRGDIPWFRGYCHVLAAGCDMVLAYDHQRLFDHCAHLLYPRIEPHDPTVAISTIDEGDTTAKLLDVVAAIHLIDFPLAEPARMVSARQHLLAMVATSRESWKLILAETDNDREWLPNPRQTGVLQVPVTQEMVDSWQEVLKEMEDLLEGRLLVPFWRETFRVFGPAAPVAKTGRGINLKRVFEEPRRFDLVLTLQGSAVMPYLEEGPLSLPETWGGLARVFRGQFFGFALWFN